MDRTKQIALILEVLVLSLFTTFAFATWEEPTLAPPGGNVSVPINVGGDGQTKSGAFTVQGDFTAPVFYDDTDTNYYINPSGDSIFSGNLTIGGWVSSTQLCIGDDCQTDWSEVGTSYWILSGTDLYASSTSYNIGIGTTNPSEKLEIGGNFAASGTGVFGTTTRDADNVVRVLANDTHKAGFEAYGSLQGTGYSYVGQSALYGGGMFYNGDGTPAFATGEAADRISFYRNNNGTTEVVFSYPHNSNTVTFRGQIDMGSNKITGLASPGSDSDAASKSYVDSTVGGGEVATATAATNALACSLDGTCEVITIDSGQGQTEVYLMDQNVQTSNAVTFTTIDTGQGANELYDMDQNVLTTSSTTFVGITITGSGSSFSQPVVVGTPTGDTHAATKSYVDSGIALATSTQYWTLDSSDLYPNDISYNVGVGTATPTANLEVYGGGDVFKVSTSSQELFTVSDTQISSKVPHSFTSAGDVALSYDLQFTNTTASYIKSYAPLYINAGDPNQNHDLTLKGSNLGEVIVDDDLYVSDSLEVIGSGSSFTQPLTVGSPTGDSHAATKNYVDSTVTGGEVATATAATNAMACSLDGTCEVITIDSGQGQTEVYLMDQNVQTTSSTTFAGITITGSGSSFTQPVTVGSPTADSHAATRSYVDSSIVSGIGTATSTQYWTLSGTDLYPDSTDYNVGIGTTDPGAKLDVQGVISGASQRGYRGDWNLDVTSEGFDFTFGRVPENLKHMMVIRLEQTDLEALIHVKINSNDLGVVDGTNAVREWNEFKVDDAYINTLSDNTIRIEHDGGAADWGHIWSVIFEPNFIAYDENGYVGIGTTTPAYGLDVWGTGSFTQPVIVGAPTGDSHAATRSYVDSSITSGIGTATSTQYWTLSGTDLYPDSTTYNVGIGTTDPGVYKLKVDGTFDATTITQGGTAVSLSGHSHAASDVTSGEFAEARVTKIDSKDTRATNPDPQDYTSSMQTDFKANTSDGLSDGSSYHGVISYRPYGATVDWSGGPMHQLGLTANKNLWIRSSTGDTSWGTWYQIARDEMTNDFAFMGDVGIGTTTPAYGLDVWGTGHFTQPVIVGAPTASSHAATKNYVDSAVTVGEVATATVAINSMACSADGTCEMQGADLQGGDITGVDKLTVTTIDPVYTFNDKEYATYVSSLAGGVREEYVGKGNLSSEISGQYEYVVDFDNLEEGSDLWLWGKVIDFSKENIEVLATPYGQLANIYYIIQENKIIFRGDNPVEFSYRLLGRRHDWKDWPTLITEEDDGQE